jgi:hypothetical protein
MRVKVNYYYNEIFNQKIKSGFSLIRVNERNYIMPETKSKWTAAQVKEHILKIQKLIETEKQKVKKDDNFTAVTPDELETKFKRVNSPMIVFQSCTGSTTPGGTINYNVGVYNPDPTNSIWMYSHVWIGSGNVDPVTGTFLLNVDTRYPRLTEPSFPGFSLAPGASTTLSFSIKVPSGMEKSTYLINSCLMKFNWHDIGMYLDRSVITFRVI